MSTQPPIDRIALDAAAVVQSLSRCAAEFQAKAAAQKAVVAAATKRSLGLLAADAALMVEVYEEAAATMFSTIQGIVTGRGAEAVPSPNDVRSASTDALPGSTLQSFCDGVSPAAQKLCARALNDKVSAPDRYAAFSGLVRELNTRPVRADLPVAVYTALHTLYAAITDKLPDLGEVEKALQKIEQDWRRSDGTSASSTSSPDAEQLRRSDWFKKVQGHVGGLLRIRGKVAAATAEDQRHMVSSYESIVDVVLANLFAQQWPAEAAPMVEAVRRELGRLRHDCGVVVAMAALTSAAR